MIVCTSEEILDWLLLYGPRLWRQLKGVWDANIHNQADVVVEGKFKEIITESNISKKGLLGFETSKVVKSEQETHFGDGGVIRVLETAGSLQQFPFVKQDG